MKVLAIILGLVLVDVAVRGTYENAGGANSSDNKGLIPLLKGDFEPGAKGNFVAWFAAILLIGFVGYVPDLKPIANAMLVLVILVLLLANSNPQTGTDGFFAMLKQQATVGPPATMTSSAAWN